jgi:hypothetical protein
MSVRDLTSVPALNTFPWETVYTGLAKSRKTMTTFYGDVHSTKFTRTLDDRWTDRDQWRWYNALRHGVNVEGFNVNVTALPNKYMHFDQHWWARSHEPIWEPTDNAKYFDVLRQWIDNSGIFKHTGRQTFFIQIAGQSSPLHTDFDPAGVPEHLRKPGEFIWLTPPDRPKQLTIAGQTAPWCCWFNHFDWHGTAPEKDTRWSLRIDGSFSDEFKTKFINPI